MDLTALAALLEPYRHCRRWWIAYSGGLDSHVLLHLLAGPLRGAGPPLAAIHVNHQLNPHAPAWAEHCRAVCAGLGVELRVAVVQVPDSTGRGLEAAARSARYEAFDAVLDAGELLLQAHHRDDQAETLLWRLLRGAGSTGLAAIPAARTLGRGQLLRPLLTLPRAELLAYAQRHGLQWIHDDSNDDTRFDRNFLRQRVAPVLAERWPGYAATLGRFAAQAAQTNTLLRDLADIDLAAAQRGAALDVPACLALAPARQYNLLRRWLALAGLPPPGRARLEQIAAQLGARADAEPCVSWRGGEVRRYRDRLYALAPLPAAPVAVDMAWSPAQVLRAPGLGELSASAVSGGGLRADRDYRVRNRRGGERCRPLARAHSQSLKKLLQEAAVPPWWRERLPLVYCGAELAAVADLWICEGFHSAAQQPGWQLHWRAPGSVPD